MSLQPHGETGRIFVPEEAGYLRDDTGPVVVFDDAGFDWISPDVLEYVLKPLMKSPFWHAKMARCIGIFTSPRPDNYYRNLIHGPPAHGRSCELPDLSSFVDPLLPSPVRAPHWPDRPPVPPPKWPERISVPRPPRTRFTTMMHPRMAVNIHAEEEAMRAFTEACRRVDHWLRRRMIFLPAHAPPVQAPPPPPPPPPPVYILPQDNDAKRDAPVHANYWWHVRTMANEPGVVNFQPEGLLGLGPPDPPPPPPPPAPPAPPPPAGPLDFGPAWVFENNIGARLPYEQPVRILSGARRRAEQLGRVSEPGPYETPPRRLPSVDVKEVLPSLSPAEPMWTEEYAQVYQGNTLADVECAIECVQCHKTMSPGSVNGSDPSRVRYCWEVFPNFEHRASKMIVRCRQCPSEIVDLQTVCLREFARPGIRWVYAYDP